MKFQTKHESLPSGAYLAKQVHGTRALRIRSGDDIKQIAEEAVDALWTTDSGVILAVKTADCAPVLLWHQQGRCVIAIHAGWRGAVAGIIAKTLSEVTRETSFKPEEFEAAIGPCIGFDIYEVGPEVAAQVPKEFLKPGQGDRFYFDLRGLIKQQLEKAGVEKISVSKHCTQSEPENYFSARRGDTGRQFSVVQFSSVSPGKPHTAGSALAAIYFGL